MGGDILNVKKDLVVAVLLGFFLAVALYPKVASVGEYDPWSDINSDGKMRVDDILDVALRFGADGDPTRNVTVVNWPNSSDVSVWWNQYLTTSDSISSAGHFAEGFGQLHVLMRGASLTSGEVIRFVIYAKLWNPDHTSNLPVPVYSGQVTSATPWDFTSIPVPSEEFWFYAYTDSLSNGYAFLSFYLTWA